MRTASDSESKENREYAFLYPASPDIHVRCYNRFLCRWTVELRFTLMSGQSCTAHRASWDSFPDDEETIERSAEAIRFARFLRKYSVPAIFLETNRIRAMRSRNSIDICIDSSLDCVRSNERRNVKGLYRYFLASNVLSASSILKKIKVLLVPLCHLPFSSVSFKYAFNMLQSVQIDGKLVITSRLH